MFKGTISILGFKVKSEIIVHFPSQVKVYAELPVVNFAGGLIKLSRSHKDLENGPLIHVEVTKLEVSEISLSRLTALNLK